MTRKTRLFIAAYSVLFMALPMFAQSGGEATFKSKCAMCHGADGLASSSMAKTMGVPSIQSDQFKKFTETELMATVENGKGKMPAYKGKLTDAQIREVISYMQTLEKK